MSKPRTRCLRLELLLTVLVIVTTAGCSGSIPGVCGDALSAQAVPAETTLAVSQQFTPRMNLATCDGGHPVVDTFIWSASDTTIVRVDPGTGVTTGLAQGTTSLTATGVIYGPLSGTTVTVR
jgi:hypothetical protein